MSDFVTRWERRQVREQFARMRQDVVDRAAADALNADEYWAEAASWIGGPTAPPQQEEPDGSPPQEG